MRNVIELIARTLRYAWAAPCSAVGLSLVLPLVFFGARFYWIYGVLEVALPPQQKPGFRTLHRLPFCALTLGHIVIGLTVRDLQRSRAHEHEHVKQYERWGLFFFLAYPASSLYQWLLGNKPYWDNWFEVQARQRAAGIREPY